MVYLTSLHRYAKLFLVKVSNEARDISSLAFLFPSKSVTECFFVYLVLY